MNRQAQFIQLGAFTDMPSFVLPYAAAPDYTVAGNNFPVKRHAPDARIFVYDSQSRCNIVDKKRLVQNKSEQALEHRFILYDLFRPVNDAGKFYLLPAAYSFRKPVQTNKGGLSFIIAFEKIHRSICFFNVFHDNISRRLSQCCFNCNTIDGLRSHRFAYRILKFRAPFPVCNKKFRSFGISVEAFYKTFKKIYSGLFPFDIAENRMIPGAKIFDITLQPGFIIFQLMRPDFRLGKCQP